MIVISNFARSVNLLLIKKGLKVNKKYLGFVILAFLSFLIAPGVAFANMLVLGENPPIWVAVAFSLVVTMGLVSYYLFFLLCCGFVSGFVGS